jgi:hypothetical protein
MSRPVSKIEVWEPGGGAALYTIFDAVSIYHREILTTGIGNFTFRVFSHKHFSGTYTYPNIDVGDTVKIWLDWDAVAGNANFIGKITKRTGPILTRTGWVREISGLSQGEILLRRHKTNKFYSGIDADDIVEEWADDLSLGKGDIAADTNQPEIEVRTKTYFDLMRFISDFWIDAGHQIKKDFWVDLDRDLVWKARPLRTVGVETFTTADFLADPQVIRDIDSVKNNIVVYGAADTFKPADQDYCETLDDWSVTTGENLRLDVPKKVGTWAVYVYTGNLADTVDFQRAITQTNIRFINELRFWRFLDTGAGGADPCEVRLQAPDATNYFKASLTTSAGWLFKTLPLGPTHIYDVDKNPNGDWTPVGSPNWWDINAIQFVVTYPVQDQETAVDGMYFTPDRWSGSASDIVGDQRDAEFTDDKLHSDTECDQRAETLLYQLKGLPVQIQIAVLGNDNVLIGDRLTLTIPSEAITAQPYDVIIVENALTLDNWITQPTMVNSADIRQPLTTTPQRSLMNVKRALRELGMDEKSIK